MRRFVAKMNAHGAAEIIRSLGSLWLLLIVVLAFLYRGAIGRGLVAAISEIQTSRLRSLRVGPLALELYETVVDETRQILESQEYVPVADNFVPAEEATSLLRQLGDLALVAPDSAIAQAHARVEAEIRAKVGDELARDPAGRRSSATAMARRGLKAGVIRASVVPAVEGLTTLRDLAAHRESTTYDQAREYLELADALLYAIRAG